MSVKLTGNYRYRLHKRLFRKPLLVLQVEVEGYETEMTGGYVDRYKVKYYRDATIEEITTEEMDNG